MMQLVTDTLDFVHNKRRLLKFKNKLFLRNSIQLHSHHMHNKHFLKSISSVSIDHPFIISTRAHLCTKFTNNASLSIKRLRTRAITMHLLVISGAFWSFLYCLCWFV